MLYQGLDFTEINSMLRIGIEMNWIARNCRECADSGGRCGYNNESSSNMQCFCAHGPYPPTCPSESLLCFSYFLRLS